jgi:hypothetical protein
LSEEIGKLLGRCSLTFPRLVVKAKNLFILQQKTLRKGPDNLKTH